MCPDLIRSGTAHHFAAVERVESRRDEVCSCNRLDLDADSPETIALSIVAEIQKSFTNATALPLRQVRATALAVSSSSPAEATLLERQSADSRSCGGEDAIAHRR